MTNNRFGPLVAVTGSSGYIGSQLLQELENQTSIAKLIAIDTKSLSMPLHNIYTYRLDITKPLDKVFHHHQISTVVHLAFDMREGQTHQEAISIQARNLAGLQNLLVSCRAGKVKNVVYLSSHTVYGAHPGNPVPITEEKLPNPIDNFHYGQTKYLSETILRDFAEENPRIGVTILRCCMVIGPGGTSYAASGFQKPFLVKVLGHDPPLQFIHDSDLARVLTIFSIEPRPGIYNVAGDGIIPYSRMARMMGKRLVTLPPFLAYPLVTTSWKLGLQRQASSSGLSFIRYPIVLTNGKLKKYTGYRFHYSSEEAVRSYALSNV